MYRCNLFIFKGPFGSKDEKNEMIENREIMKKWENRKDFSFSYLCLIGWWKSEGMKNFFVWLEREIR